MYVGMTHQLNNIGLTSRLRYNNTQSVHFDSKPTYIGVFPDIADLPTKFGSEDLKKKQTINMVSRAQPTFSTKQKC